MWSKSRRKSAKKPSSSQRASLKTSLLTLPLCFLATSWWLARVSWNPATSSVRHKRNSSQLGNAHTAPHDTVHRRGANSSGGEEKCTQVQVAAGYWFLNAWNNHNNGNKKVTSKLLHSSCYYYPHYHCLNRPPPSSPRGRLSFAWFFSCQHKILEKCPPTK